jgi:two-component system, NarL family, response regulator YdfI
MKIRVAIVAGGAIVRSGLAAMLVAQPEIVVVGSASDLTELAREVDRWSPDVILLDSGNLTLAAAWEQLTAMQDLQARSIPIVIIDDCDRVDLSLATRAGVRGILATTSTEAEIVAALSAVALGLIVFAPEAIELFDSPKAMLRERERGFGAGSIGDNSESSLTPREIEVLVRLGSGLGNKAIAQALQISEHTVKFHISSIFQKLGVSSRTEAVAMGIRLGLILL